MVTNTISLLRKLILTHSKNRSIVFFEDDQESSAEDVIHITSDELLGTEEKQDTCEEEKNYKEIEEYLSKDPEAKFQFDSNKNTCFANTVPEFNISDVDTHSMHQGKAKLQ